MAVVCLYCSYPVCFIDFSASPKVSGSCVANRVAGWVVRVKSPGKQEAFVALHTFPHPTPFPRDRPVSPPRSCLLGVIQRGGLRSVAVDLPTFPLLAIIFELCSEDIRR